MKPNELLSPDSVQKNILNDMITLVNNQKIPTNEDSASNSDIIIDSKLHSQVPIEL